jgi:hypothetical protein
MLLVAMFVPTQWTTYNVKHEEAGSDGEKCALVKGRKTIGYGRHGMFSNTPVDISPAVVAVDAALCPQIGLVLVSFFYYPGVKELLTC